MFWARVAHTQSSELVFLFSPAGWSVALGTESPMEGMEEVPEVFAICYPKFVLDQAKIYAV